MTRECDRRTVLAATGSALGGLAVSGCLDRRARYWNDPPSFDRAGLERVLERPVPDRPDPIPVGLADAQRAAFVDRVDELLAPIPDPLTVETLPNGAIREEIATEREAAQNAVERVTAATTALSTVAAAADACERAATAAGTWAAVSVNRSPKDVLRSAILPEDAAGRNEELPGDAADPEEGTIVYAPIEKRVSGFDGTPTGLGRRDPLRTGSHVGSAERARVEAVAGTYLRERYVESLEQPRPIAAELRAAVDDLAPRTADRLLEFSGAEEYPWYGPSVDEILDREAPRDEPGVRLLSGSISDLFERIRYEPVAWPDVETTEPSLTLRETHRALLELDAIEVIRDRVDDGDDLFPADGETVQTARSDAIDAVDALARSSSPFDRWTAWCLAPRFDDPDETLASEDDPARRTVASAYGDYYWIETVARAAPETTAIVEDALS